MPVAPGATVGTSAGRRSPDWPRLLRVEIKAVKSATDLRFRLTANEDHRARADGSSYLLCIVEVPDADRLAARVVREVVDPRRDWRGVAGRLCGSCTIVRPCVLGVVMQRRRSAPAQAAAPVPAPSASGPASGTWSNAEIGGVLGTAAVDDGTPTLAAAASLGNPNDAGARHELDYNVANVGGELRDPEQRDGALPYNPDGSWRHDEILAALSQIDNDPITEVDGMRCSSVAFLGAQIASGPGRVATLASAVQAEMRQVLDAGAWPILDGVRQSMESDRVGYLRRIRPLLPAISARLAARSATYSDLRVLSAAVNALRDTGEDAAGLDPSERQGLAALTPEADRVVNEVRRGWSGAQQLFAELAPGQAALVGISTTGERVDHNITIGNDGAIYVFDPAPRRGTQFMRLSSHERDIRDYFEMDQRPLNFEIDRFVPAGRAPGGRAG